MVNKDQEKGWEVLQATISSIIANIDNTSLSASCSLSGTTMQLKLYLNALLVTCQLVLKRGEQDVFYHVETRYSSLQQTPFVSWPRNIPCDSSRPLLCILYN